MRNVVLDVVGHAGQHGAMHVATVAVPAQQEPAASHLVLALCGGQWLPNGEGKHCSVKDPAKPAVKPFIQPPAKKA